MMKRFLNAILKGFRFILSIGPIAGPVILVLIVCIIFGGSIFSFSRFVSFDVFSKIGEPEIHVAPVVSEIKKMNRIYLLKVLVGFFDKQEASEGKVKKFRFTGDLVDATSFYWQRVRGHAFVSINLKKLELLEQDQERKHLTLKLPLPEIESPTVNMDPKNGTVVYRKGYYWYTSQKIKDEFYKNAMPRAQAGIEKKVTNPKYIAMAKDQAGEIFTALFKPIGWTVEIQWDEEKKENPGSSVAQNAK